MARTFVWHHGDGVVVGYYTLASYLLVKDKLPRVIGRGSPKRIPAVLLARLVLDRHLQGNGLESVVLAEALERAVDATNLVAARFVVVDALDERANRFCGHMASRPFPPPCALSQNSPMWLWRWTYISLLEAPDMMTRLDPRRDKPLFSRAQTTWS